MEHRSVLKKECLDLLRIKPDGIYVDMTLGRAGHAVEILGRLSDGWLYGIDRDLQAIYAAATILAAVGTNYTLLPGDFGSVGSRLPELGVTEVDGILMDLGVSSPQFDQPQRGFSYRSDGPLDMRMDQSQALSAYQVVNEYSQNELRRILRDYGEEPYAAAIAANIVKQRPLTGTLQLAEVIKASLPNSRLSKKGHPAKQSFQAIRIAVNDELGQLKQGLSGALALLAPQGRLAVLTFHSLEDRIVKQKFHEVSTVYVAKRLPLKAEELPQADFNLVNKRVIIPEAAERLENPRSTGAKLRVIERAEVKK